VRARSLLILTAILSMLLGAVVAQMIARIDATDPARALRRVPA